MGILSYGVIYSRGYIFLGLFNINPRAEALAAQGAVIAAINKRYYQHC